MIFEFINSTENMEGSQIIHIIEHEGYGTLHQLIETLQEDFEQHVVCTYNLMSMKFVKSNVCYVIHTTGHFYPIISNLKLLFDNDVKVFVFLHVAPRYFELKEKAFFLDYICNIQHVYNLRCFCPSTEVAGQYKNIGLNVSSIQIGFPKINLSLIKGTSNLEAYEQKYITVCTSSDPRYIHLKGINEFIDIMEKYGKKSDSLILGFDGTYRGIMCKRLQLNDFLYVLKNSKAYIQLSMTEAYNLTAVQAKRLRIPIIVSDIDGHKNCMKSIDNRLNIDEDFIEKFKLASSLECINKNYKESCKRESIERFIKSIRTNIKGEI